MKIEQINENQIRCTLTSDDLSVRNLRLGELAYGTEKVRNLFSEMVEKASEQFGFNAEGTPIIIEAIPFEDESIVLLITKVDSPDELDGRFARFTPNPEENFMDKLVSMIGEAIPMVQDSFTPEQKLVPETAKNTQRAFVFKSLDAAIEAAKALDGAFDGKNCLYKNPVTREYYLYIENAGSDPTIYASTCNVLSEYAGISLHNNQGTSYMTEHYEMIIKKDALKALAQI